MTDHKDLQLTPAPEAQPVRDLRLDPGSAAAPTPTSAVNPEIAGQVAGDGGTPPQAAAAAPNITIINQNHQTNAGGVIVVREKSLLLALVLTFFFGPLGMLYSTIPGAAVMFLLALVIGLPTGGVGLAILWPFQLLWTFLSVRGHNARQLRRAV